MMLLLASFVACSEPVAPVVAAPPAAAPAPPVAPSPAPAVALGEVFTAADVVPVDTLLAKSADWDGKPVVVEATVKEVCQKKGCWHTLATASPDVSVMVKDKEYKIFLPKDAAGKKVRVKGTFAIAEVPEDEARHYAEDAGRDPSAIHGPQRTFAIDAEGVQFVEG